jgi:hypothetical protein
VCECAEQVIGYLAQSGTKCPFHIQGYGMVFYEEVISCEVKLSEALLKQLSAILSTSNPS